MHTTSPDMHRGARRTVVVPLVWIVAACHLAPHFGQFNDDFPFERHDLLSVANEFFFNHYSSHFVFGMVDHWRAIQEKIDEAKAAEDRAREEEATHAKAIRAKAMRVKLIWAQDHMNAVPE